MSIDERRIFWSWNSSDPKDHEILARCVQEGLNEINLFIKEAEEVLKANTGDRSFDAYGRGPKRVREQVKALFEYFQGLKPKIGTEPSSSYSWEPWDSTRMRQRIRLIRELLHYGRGTCIEWVLFLASCLANVLLNPLIIIAEAGSERHAILGYWLKNRTLPDPVTMEKDFVRFLQKHRDEKEKLLGVVNATRIPPNENGQRRSLDGKEGAEWEAITWLPNDARLFVVGPVQQIDPAGPDQKILLVVDIRAARNADIKPLRPLEEIGGHTLTPARHFQWRPELEKIKDWWRNESTYGVLTLVGMGGAGKSSLVRRFLAHVPPLGENADIREEGVKKDETLPISDALFVWSFSEHPDVDRCATELYNYLTGEQVAKATFEQVQDVLSKNWRSCRVLLVFNGIERLQIVPRIEPEEGGGTFGQFLPEGAPLGRFLSWCCDGPRPAHVLITSRFRLTELQDYRESYRVVDCQDFPLESAKALLKATGVKGLEWQLKELIQKFGNHALTLELLGNYIVLFHNGDPAPVLSKDIPPLESEEVRVQTETKDTETPSVRLADILQFYEERLQKDDAAALGVLQRLCLFHIIPVDEQLLAEIFSKAEKSVAGPLAGLTPEQIRRHLLNLCGKYRLAHGEPKENPKRFSVHPAVREHFYMRIDQKIVLHDAVRQHLALLAESPTFNKPTDPAALDVLEELVYHTSQVAQQETALRLYWSRFGGYPHLGQKLGAYSRGEALLQMIIPHNDFLSAQISAPKEAQLLFFHDRGNYLKVLGYLDKAAWCFRQQACDSVANSDYLAGSIAFQDLTYVLLSQGYLYKGELACEEALKLAGRMQDAAELMHSYADRAHVRALRGETNEARIDFGAALYYKIAGAPHEACCVITPDGWLLTSWHNISVSATGVGSKMLLHYSERPYEVTVDVQRSAPERDLAVLKAELDLSKSEAFIRRPESQVSHLMVNATEPMLQIQVRTDTLYGIPGVWYGHLLLRLHDLTKAEQTIALNEEVGRQYWGHTTALCDILYSELFRNSELFRMQGKADEACKVLTQALDWGVRTADQEVLIWGNLISARLALDTDNLDEAERAICEGLRIAEYCGYGLYWIDLQVAKGQWELACGRQLQQGEELPLELGIWTPQQWFERAETSALRALNGQPKDSNDPAPQSDLPEGQLAMLGARHPECGYAWGEGDALHLLGEALLVQWQTKEAEQRLEEALALRQRIQDPKAEDTRQLLAQLGHEKEG